MSAHDDLRNVLDTLAANVSDLVRTSPPISEGEIDDILEMIVECQTILLQL